MKRDVVALSRDRFDVLVLGGGIHGALVAWDASLRGLSVAMIDRGDFGSATSQNSLKIIHGGLRYLQDGNIGRVRTMASERSTWMRIAPHLVHPISCLTPTYTTLSRSRLALSIALKINDLLGHSHNNLQDPGKQLNNSRVLSLEEFKRFLPEIELKKQTGAALWQDAMMYNSERLLLSFILSAERLGAIVANYVEAVELLCQDLTVTGVKARNVLTGQEFDIQSQIVINATGAWIDELRPFPQKQNNPGRFSPSIAMNLVTRQLWPDCAAGLPNTPVRSTRNGKHPSHSQIFFFVPWRKFTLIGTWHFPWHGSPGSFKVNEEIIQQFIENINWVDPNINLSKEDILHVHWGFLPIHPQNDQKWQLKLVREGRVVDHQVEDGIAGYITLVGVKYTTARVVAQQAVDLAARKLGKKTDRCQTQTIPVWGGQIELFDDFLAQALKQTGAIIEQDTIEHLVYTYGSAYQYILQYLDQEPWLGEKVDPASPVIKAEVVHAVRHEMALTLRDVVQRRTELGAAGLPEPSTLQICVDLIGSELGWDEATKKKSIEEVFEAYPLYLKERAVVNQLTGKNSLTMDGKTTTPWQIVMFKRSLKKQKKLSALLKMLGNVDGLQCLLVTCGDNNGALNWYFRSHGGHWTWADVSGENNEQIADLLGEPVHTIAEDTFPFTDEQFDCIVSIDVLEHLKHDQPFLLELTRVLKKGGKAVVTVPNGDPNLLANRIKWRVGMRPEIYGHTRAGYTLAELTHAITSSGLKPEGYGGYSRFFTEMIELVINYGYVYILSKKQGGTTPGHIAPVSSGELNKHGFAYRLYSVLFPIANLFSNLDALLLSTNDNAVIVSAVKQE